MDSEEMKEKITAKDAWRMGIKARNLFGEKKYKEAAEIYSRTSCIWNKLGMFEESVRCRRMAQVAFDFADAQK